MPLVITLDRAPRRHGQQRLATGTMAWDSSYPAGGEVITPAMFGMLKYLDSVAIVGESQGYRIGFDKPNSTLKIVGPTFLETVLNPDQATRVLTAGAADVAVFHAPKAMYVTGLYSVVDLLLATDTIVPVMSVDVADADAATARVELATITYVDADAVGALDSYSVTGGAVGGGATTAAALATPYLVAAGRSIVLEHKTAGTDSGAAAGSAKVFITVADYDANLELDTAHNLSGLTAVRFEAWGY